MADQDKDFLETTIKFLVDNPDKVKVDRTVDEMGVLLTLDVDPADMGQVIGRRGNTARAIRTLLRVVGAKNNARVNLKINQPEGTERPAPRTESTEEAPVAPATEAADTEVEDLKL
ncbi:KH domain-containing protein [bacterium]|nr:KH domain-containing protein [bacterium]